MPMRICLTVMAGFHASSSFRIDRQTVPDGYTFGWNSGGTNLPVGRRDVSQSGDLPGRVLHRCREMNVELTLGGFRGIFCNVLVSIGPFQSARVGWHDVDGSAHHQGRLSST